MDAALLCSSYLSFGTLDTLFDAESYEEGSVQGGIKQGDFVFFDYASNEWLAHLQAFLTNRPSPDELKRLSEAVSRLASSRESHVTEASIPPKYLLDRFINFQEDDPDLQTLLARAALMHDKAQLGLLDNDGEFQAVFPTVKNSC
jgi:hypothetical protein